MLSRGDVIFYRDFVYYDGSGKVDKYLVLLNTPSTSEPCLFVPATKRNRGRPKAKGCLSPHQAYFMPARSTGIFPLDTWLPLFPLYPCSVEAISTKRKVGNLPVKIFADIIDCARNSASQDYEKMYKKLIFPPIEDGARKLMEKFNKHHS